MVQENAAPKSPSGNPFIMIVVLLVFGLVLGGFGLHRYNLGKGSGSWPVARGKITYAQAVPQKVKKSQEYRASLKYTYTVNGSSYTGRRITASDVYLKTLSSANDILRKYPVGGEVSVHYDPANPGTSLLESGIKKNVYVLFGGAALCILFAVAITVSEIKKKRLMA